MSGGGGKGGKGKLEVIDYKMSVQWAVCAEDVDSVNKIYLNDREVPDLGLPRLENAVVTVDNLELFGGPKKGGGIKGDVHFLFGGLTQQMSAILAAKHERTPTTMTGHRGFLSLFFTGTGENTNGFVWATNNPMIPAPEVEVTRLPKTLTGFTAAIGEDANPAAIIHECMTNAKWGAGYQASAINLTSFQAAATTLINEGFGLSFEWTPDGPVEEFVNEVLRHINGRLNFDMETGEWELSLLRDDYDVGAIPVISRQVGKLKEYQRKTWADVVGNLVVSFTNPDNEEAETVTLYDAAATAIQSIEVRDNSERYVGVRDLDLAWKVVERDLRQRSALLATATVEIPFAMESVEPGKPVLLDWTDEPLNGESDFRLQDIIVMRVMAIRPTQRGSAAQTVTLMEDVFSYGAAPRPVVSSVVVSDQSSPPQDVVNYRIMGVPFYMVAIALGDSDARNLVYPSTVTTVIADAGGSDVRDIDLRRSLSGTYSSVSIIDDQISFSLPGNIPVEKRTTISGAFRVSGLGVGDMLAIGLSPNDEIVVISDIDYINDEFTVERGMIDTIPRNWAGGIVVLGIDTGTNTLDTSSHAVGENLVYKMLPTTSQGSLQLDQASPHTFTADERMHLPYRPANLSFNSQEGFTFDEDVATDDWTFAWAWRNRITETGALLAWDEGTVLPETGQTLLLRLRRNGTIYEDVTISDGALTQHTFSVPSGDRDVDDVFVVEFIARRDGFDAHQAPTITLTLE